MSYLLGAGLGGCLGMVATFFSLGGISRRNLFPRLVRRRGKWWWVGFSTVCLLTAVGVYGVWIHGRVDREVVGYLLLCCYLLSVTLPDLRKREIPDDATVFFCIVFLVYQIQPLSFLGLLHGGVGAFVGGILLGLPHLLRSSSVGLGDVKLLAVCGLLTGFPGILYLLIRSLLVAAVFSIIMLLSKRAQSTTQIPLAPFLLIGAIIS